MISLLMPSLVLMMSPRMVARLHDILIFAYLEREVRMISLLMPSLVLMMSPRMVARDSKVSSS